MLPQRWWPPLLALFVLARAAATAEGREEARRLRAWLQGLKVSLPTVEVLPEHLGFGVQVSRGVCRELHVGGLAIEDARGGAEDFRADVVLSNVSFACVATAEMEMMGMRQSCEVGLTVGGSSLALGLSLAAREGLPAPLPPPQARCRAEVNLEQLHFEGRALDCAALRLASGAIRALVGRLANQVCQEVRETLEEQITQLSRRAVAAAERYSRPVPPLAPPARIPDGTLDLQRDFWEAAPGVSIRSFAKHVAHMDDPARFNDVLVSVLSDWGWLGADGSFRLPAAESLLPARYEVHIPLANGTAQLEAVLESVVASNLTTIRTMRATVPSTQTGYLGGSFTPSVHVGLRAQALNLQNGSASLAIGGLSMNITEAAPLAAAEVAVSLHAEASATAAVFVALDKSSLRSHALDQMQHLACAAWLTVHELPGGPLQLLDLHAEASSPTLRVELPGLDAEELEEQLLAALEELVRALRPPFGAALGPVLGGVLSGPVRDLANERLASYLRAPHLCPGSNFSSGTVEDVERPARLLASGLLWASLCLGLVTPALALGLAVAGRVRNGSPREGEAAPVEAPLSPVALPVRRQSSLRRLLWRRPSALIDGMLEAEAEEAEREERNQRSALSRSVPPPLRWGMVLGILGTVCLFVLATVTPGVALQLHFSSAKESWFSPDIARLSLDNTFSRLLESRAYYLAGLVLVFSMIWPYAKLMLMLYAWLAPLSVRQRGPLLTFLDRVGKWSLTDNLVMFLLIVLCWIRWEGGDVTAAPPTSGAAVALASLGLKCSPEEELNLFVAATVLSMVLGHLMLGAHRWQCGMYGTKATANGESNDEPIPLCQKLRAGPEAAAAWAIPWTTMGLVVTLVLLLAAFGVEIVEIEMGGLVGTFHDLVGQPRTVRYSLLSIVQCLRTQGSLYLQLVLAVFAMILPLLYLASLLVLWLAPLTRGSQLKIFALVQTMNAWSSLDVFAVALLGAVLGGNKYGLGQFMEYVLYNQNMGPLCQDLKSLGVECMTVQIDMLPLAAVLMAAALAVFAVGVLVYRRAHLALYAEHPRCREREEAEQRGLDEERRAAEVAPAA